MTREWRMIFPWPPCFPEEQRMHVRNVWLTLVKGCLVLGFVGHGVGACDAMAWDRKTHVLSVDDLEILGDSISRLTGFGHAARRLS